ncbi:GNAT family N-acetyltransferase [Hwangdonia sp.]|uniref:GNAT family N-acetyltransferase n=1 Tax=Hwangdonia sp. TaxID=1883432 RepID=UPI003AB5221B
MIKSNPFFSSTFIKKWHRHFNTEKPLYSFDFIKNISFYKPRSFPLFINSGKNLTKGVSYSLDDESAATDFKSKCFLIYDVPKFFNVKTNSGNKNLKVKKAKQYPGFLIHLDKHKDFNTYFKSTFSKSSVQKFRRYNRRLEHCFSITYKMYYGEIDKKEYDFVFSYFNKLLTKRFDDKQITNNNLNPEEWNFYYDVVYPLILEKKASLFVIYNDGIPITVRLNYFSEDIIFDAITVFDIDYSKFHIGKISIMKILEWAFNNDFKTFDFTKGYFDYKESWSDLKYDFEYHIYYDSKSVTAALIANYLYLFFKLKQSLREKDINTKLHKALFFLKNNKSSNANNYHIKPIINSKDFEPEKTQEIDINSTENTFLRKIVFDYLYTSSENLKHINLYKCKTASNSYILTGNKDSQLITHS